MGAGVPQVRVQAKQLATKQRGVRKGLGVDMSDAKTAAEIGGAAYGAGKAAGSAAAAKHTVIMAVTGLTLATVVVMALTMPKNKAEFFVALISTVVSSISGGSWAIQEWNLLASVISVSTDIELWIGLAKLGGVFFVCGLPGWVIVRSLFVFTEARKAKGIDVFVRDIKRIVRK